MFNDYIKTKEAQAMLNENIKNLRKAKGLSQEELANRLNVVRQTISKWEKGLSVPDSSMLISLADELDTSVSILLGETVPEHGLKETDLKSISEKLESINLQFAKRSRMRIRLISAPCIVCAYSGRLYCFCSDARRISGLGLQQSGICSCRDHTAWR